MLHFLLVWKGVKYKQLWGGWDSGTNTWIVVVFCCLIGRGIIALCDIIQSRLCGCTLRNGYMETIYINFCGVDWEASHNIGEVKDFGFLLQTLFLLLCHFAEFSLFSFNNGMVVSSCRELDNNRSALSAASAFAIATAGANEGTPTKEKYRRMSLASTGQSSRRAATINCLLTIQLEKLRFTNTFRF